MKTAMRKGLKRTLAALLAGLALYALLGFVILPGIGLRIANQQLAQYSTVPAQLQRLELNPFTLKLTAWGLQIGEPGAEQVAFERLHADVQWDSLWTGALHLQAVELDGPRSEILFDKQGRLNLAHLFALPPSPTDTPKDDSVFPLRIDRLHLTGGYLHFQDLRPSAPIDLLYDSLNLELKHLSTLPDDPGEMTLAASGADSGKIAWSGRVSLSPLASQGTLKVSDSPMKVWWPYVRDALPLVLQEGMLDFSTDYRLDLSQQTDLKLEHAALSIKPFALSAPDQRPLVRLQRLDISDTVVDLAAQTVTVGKVRSQGLETWAAREANGQLDWQQLFAPSARTPDAAEKAAPATATQAPSATPSKPWQVRLSDVQLRDYRLHLADRLPAQPVALEVGPLNLDVQNFDSLNQRPFTLRLDTGIGKQGQLKAAGEVHLSPVSARLTVNSQDIDLRLAQAYLSPYVKLELRSGLLASDLEVALSGTEPLALQVTGRVQVDQLHTLDTLKERDFVKWQRLVLEGVDYRHGDALSIARVNLQQPYARFMINEDRSTNIDDLLIPQPADTTAQAQGKPAAPAERPLGIRVGEVAIDNGSANFADFSLTPNFATAIQQLNGQIGTIDNRQALPARIDIKGKVDRYAPVFIRGSLTPFDPMASLDISTSFNRVELTTLTPYSGKFAGYRIRKGRLNLEVHYVIKNGQLKAENKLLVDQLQLGERVDSPDAVDLPVRLAVALLKDSKGMISIELPVSGNLADPQFSVMPIVWQTLRNLVLRAAQAPFKFIGGLVSGGPQDLGSIAFAPGADSLGTEAQQALNTLAAALKQRPTLRLEIEGTSAKSSDGPLLAEQRLEREYQSIYYKMLQRRGDKVPAQASELTVPEDEKPALLEGIYRTRAKQQPPAAWEQLDTAERQAKLHAAVIASWSSNSALLRQLGQARASRIKDYLVDAGQLGDDRIYLIDASLGEAEKDGSVVTSMQLQAE